MSIYESKISRAGPGVKSFVRKPRPKPPDPPTPKKKHVYRRRLKRKKSTIDDAEELDEILPTSSITRTRGAEAASVRHSRMDSPRMRTDSPFSRACDSPPLSLISGRNIN